MKNAAPLDSLLANAAIWRGAQAQDTSYLSSHYSALDAVLPGKGIPATGLVEVLCAALGGGEVSLFVPLLSSLQHDTQGWIAVIAPPYQLYPPSLQHQGLVLDRLLFINTDEAASALWAAEQLLHTSHCAAVIVWPDCLRHTQKIALDKLLRRLQISAVSNEHLALVIRTVKQSAAPATLRLHVQQIAPGTLAVTPLKSRHGLLVSTTVEIRL